MATPAPHPASMLPLPILITQPGTHATRGASGTAPHYKHFRSLPSKAPQPARGHWNQLRTLRSEGECCLAAQGRSLAATQRQVTQRGGQDSVMPVGGNSQGSLPCLILGLPRPFLGDRGCRWSLILGRCLGGGHGVAVQTRAGPGWGPRRSCVTRHGCGIEGGYTGARRPLPGRTGRAGRSRAATRTGGTAPSWTCR